MLIQSSVRLQTERPLVHIKKPNSVDSSSSLIWSLPEQDEANGLDSSPSDVIIHITHLN